MLGPAEAGNDLPPTPCRLQGLPTYAGRRALRRTRLYWTPCPSPSLVFTDDSTAWESQKARQGLPRRVTADSRPK